MFVNIVEIHASYKTKMSYTGPRARKVAEELSQSNGTRCTVKEGIRYIKARLRGSVKKRKAK
jgi:hypothetical protein